MLRMIIAAALAVMLAGPAGAQEKKCTRAEIAEWLVESLDHTRQFAELSDAYEKTFVTIPTEMPATHEQAVALNLRLLRSLNEKTEIVSKMVALWPIARQHMDEIILCVRPSD